MLGGLTLGILVGVFIFLLDPYFSGKDDEDSVGRYDLEAWKLRKEEILKTLSSSDVAEKAWALNELKSFSPLVEEAAKLYEQYSVDEEE